MNELMGEKKKKQLQATILNKWILSLLVSGRLFGILFYSSVGSLNW